MVLEPGTDVIWNGDNQHWVVDGPYIDEVSEQPVPGLVTISNHTESERVVRTDELQPPRYSGVSLMKPKCKRSGCYSPADCKHGYCGEHCTSATHQLGNYSTRTYPKSTKKYIGVELEVEFNCARDLKRGIAAYGGHHDASLGEFSAEYKMLRPATTACKYVAKLAEELWKLKARVTTNCGFHVHIDARKIGARRLNEFFNWAYATQDHWYKLMPRSRRSNQYASPLPKDFGVYLISQPGSYHHCWINYSPYQTVEVRLHNGTLNPYKIEGWLTALIHLQNKLYDEAFSFEKIEVPEPEGKEKPAKAMFWKVFEDCPQVGLEYLKTRENNEGVIRDYAFTTLQRNEEESSNV